MLNDEILSTLKQVMQEKGIDSISHDLLEKYLNSLATNSIRSKSDHTTIINNILDRLEIK